MLTHENFTSLVASLAPLFPLEQGRPRAQRAAAAPHVRVHLRDAAAALARRARRLPRRAERASASSRPEARAHHRRWSACRRCGSCSSGASSRRSTERGALARSVFDFAVELNRSLGKNARASTPAGSSSAPCTRGSAATCVTSSAAARRCPSDTQKLFAGLGLQLAEGYGLTEASPVLTVADGRARARSRARRQGDPRRRDPHRRARTPRASARCSRAART